MKSSQKITRIQLKVNSSERYIFLGLVSTEPDYKLSLAINKKLKISLKNISPVKISGEKGSELAFSKFSDTGKTNGIVFNLVSNRTGNNFLLKKLTNVDYLFQVYDPENANNIETLAEELRDIEAVNAVFNIDLNTFKDKNLLYLTQ